MTEAELCWREAVRTDSERLLEALVATYLGGGEGGLARVMSRLSEREWAAALYVLVRREASGRAGDFRQEREARERVVRRVVAKREEPEAKKPNLCRGCGLPIAATGKRGRQPVWHEEHRPVKNVAV